MLQTQIFTYRNFIKNAFMNDSISEALIKIASTIGQESVENDSFSGMPSASRTPEHVKHAMAAINQKKLVI